MNSFIFFVLMCSEDFLFRSQKSVSSSTGTPDRQDVILVFDQSELFFFLAPGYYSGPNTKRSMHIRDMGRFGKANLATSVPATHARKFFSPHSRQCLGTPHGNKSERCYQMLSALHEENSIAATCQHFFFRKNKCTNTRDHQCEI